MNNQIEERIKTDISTLKYKRGVNRTELLNRIATRIYKLLSEELQHSEKKVFSRDRITALFVSKKISLTARKRSVKLIIDKLVLMGLIIEKKELKTAFQSRRRILKSEDFGSYHLMMAKNGYNEITYFKYFQNIDGLPQKKIVGKSGINGFPTDENGEILNGDDWDLSVLKQTKTRKNQGVFSYGNKSITFELRQYKVKSYCLIK